MARNLGNDREHNLNEAPKLDQARLFGFRNLIPVTQSGSGVQEAAELAFNKRGDENGTER